MSRYGNITYAMGLSLKRAAKLIKKARKEEKREFYYRLWLVRVPLYTSETVETFEEFYEKMNPPVVVYDFRSKEAIMADLLDS